MEEVSLNWPLEATTLEPLRPLSPEIYELENLDVNLAKLSRSELAGKLLDHLEFCRDAEEAEPFDWFTNEKSVDIFDNFPFSPQQNGANHAKTTTSAAATASASAAVVPGAGVFFLDSPEYEPASSAPPNYAFDASRAQLTYAPPPFDVGVKMSPASSTSSPAMADADETIDPLKRETLTPPDSPKDEEILELLRDIEPGDWQKLVETSSLPYSENSCSLDDDDDEEEEEDGDDDRGSWSASFGGSESGSDDPDYTGKEELSPAPMRRARRRNSKPYSRPSVEERKQRKKEQNKNAATRYRMKKKLEVEEAKNEVKQLEDYNAELRAKVEDVGREIRYLKSLMRDVYRKKGLIK